MAEAIEVKTTKSWTEFLESTPPGAHEQLLGVCEQEGATWQLTTPDIQLHCSSEICGGLRTFQSPSMVYPSFEKWTPGFITYSCRNCRRTSKLFALLVRQSGKDGTSGAAVKLGEDPPFGPHTPARVITLIGPDRDLFLRGRRAENQGLGIGAFAYYRRVVENQKGRIIREIGRVAQRLGASQDVLAEFEGAAQEVQFTKAIDRIKAAIPQVLLIDGQHNPLTLLHTALSEGLHDHTDEDCLEIAQDIRLVLTELAERASQALKEEAELKKSVTRLLNRKATAAPPGDSADGGGIASPGVANPTQKA
jgi:hypothetical protein